MKLAAQAQGKRTFDGMLRDSLLALTACALGGASSSPAPEAAGACLTVQSKARRPPTLPQTPRQCWVQALPLSAQRGEGEASDGRAQSQAGAALGLAGLALGPPAR